MWTQFARDDRGRRVVYRDPMYGKSQLSHAERESVNRSQKGLVLGSSVVSMMILLSLLLSRPMSAAVPMLAFGLGSAAFIYWIVLPPIRAALLNAKWKDRYKAIGRCPACQYEISGCAAEADGCTVCPECSGAWRMGGANTVSSARQRESS